MSPLRHRPRPAGGPARSEAGETLIEVMVTVILLGTGIIAIISSLFTSVVVARQNQEKTIASLAAQKAGEDLSAGFKSVQGTGTTITGTLNYKPCAVPADYNPITLASDPVGDAAAQNFSHYTVSVVDVDYLSGYDASNTPVFENVASSTNCNADPQKDKVVSGLQRITIEVKRDTDLIDSVVVYKRNEICPASYSSADQGPC